MDQIGYDLKRRVIAEDRGNCLESGHLRSIISHYTIDFSQLPFPGIGLSEILNMFKTLGRAAIPPGV